MKKIIFILAIVISLIFNFVVIDSMKSLAFYNAIEKNSEKVNFAFGKEKKHSKDALTYFEELSKKYHVDFKKVTYINDDKIIINTTDTSLKDKSNHNHLDLFDSNLDINIKELKDTHLSEEGTYFFSGKDKDVKTTLSLIQQNVGEVVKVDNTITMHIKIDTFTIILSSLLTLIFFVVFIHYLKSKKKDNKLLYDLGYSKINHIIFIFSDLRYYFLNYAIFNIILSMLMYLCIYKDNHFINVILVSLSTTVTLTILCVCIIMITLKFFTIQYSKNIKQSNPFLMMYTYMALSVIAVIFLALSTQNLIKNNNEYTYQQSSIKYWNSAKNTYKTQLFERGQLKNKDLQKSLGKNLKEFYNSSDNIGFLMENRNFSPAGGIVTYKMNEKENSDIEPDGKTITVDINYLKEHRIKTISNQNVLSNIVKDNNTENIIVPIKYKKYEKKIKNNFQDDFTFRKDIMNYNNRPNKNLNINIIWVDNKVEYFTYDSDIGGKKNTLSSIIAIIETGNTDHMNFEAYFTEPYTFKSKLDDPYSTIHKGLKKHHVDGYIPSVMSVYDTKVDEINNLRVNTFKYTILAFITGITFIMMTFTFIRLYFTSYQYPIFIKRNLGYSYFQIHKSILMFLLFINLLMAILILIQQNIISYLIFISIILIETIISYYSFIKLNKENTNEVLKGKKDD